MLNMSGAYTREGMNYCFLGEGNAASWQMFEIASIDTLFLEFKI